MVPAKKVGWVRMRFVKNASLLLQVALACACEEVPASSDSRYACLPLQAGSADFCAPNACVERAGSITWHEPQGPGFTAQSACPTAAMLAAQGGSLGDYFIEYDYRGADGPDFSMQVSANVCAGPLTLESLRANLLAVDASGGVYGAAGRLGNAGGRVDPRDVELLAFEGGVLHARFTPRSTRVSQDTGVLACGKPSALANCQCFYVGDAFAQTFDLLLPLPEPPR
jgi:hypothetical protein